MMDAERDARDRDERGEAGEQLRHRGPGEDVLARAVRGDDAACAREPTLAPIAAWLDAHVPHALRTAPAIKPKQ